MKTPLLSTDSDFTLAAVLGVISLGAVMSLANAEDDNKNIDSKGLADRPECVERDAPSDKPASTVRFVPRVGCRDASPAQASPSAIEIRPRVGCKRAPEETAVDGTLYVQVEEMPHVQPVPKCEPEQGHPQRIPHGLKGLGEERPICAAPPVPPALNPAFSTDLYQQLRSGEGNVFFSPYSITEAMGMVYAGSGGNTAKEIAKAMSFGNWEAPLPQLHVLRQHLGANLHKDDNKLNIANALCVTGEPPLQSYQDIVRQQFGGELFSGGLKEINAWAKKKTDGNIETILDRLDPDSACVLLNAVYFKGNWAASFDAKQTHKADFQLPAGKSVQVDMMTREGSYKVLRDKGLIAVELPYQTSASMVLIMPDKADGMAALEKQLNEQLLGEVTRGLQKVRAHDINLFMPKFKIATSYDLIDPMKKLGISDAFGLNKSDFKTMYGTSRAAISQIKHKATLEVDELGSVATAVTAVEILRESYQRVDQVRFDRPFLVLIRERETGANLFMGRINDPTAE